MGERSACDNVGSAIVDWLKGDEGLPGELAVKNLNFDDPFTDEVDLVDGLLASVSYGLSSTFSERVATIDGR